MQHNTALLLTVIGSFNIILGCFILARNTKKLSNVFFALTSLALGGWTIGIAGFLLSNKEAPSLVWAHVYYFFPQLVAVSIVLFAHIFGETKKISKFFLTLLLTSFILLVSPLLFWHGYLIEGIVYHTWGKEVLLNKVHYLIYSIYLITCLMGAEIIMLIKAKKYTGIYRAQAGLFFSGFLITGIFGVLFNLIFPWFGNYRLIWLGPIFTSVFVIAISYSVIKHKMFDVRAAIARSTAYLLAIFIVVSVYSMVIFGLGDLLIDYQSSNLSKQFLNITMAIAIALTYAPLKKRFDKLSNRFFYRDAYEVQDFIDKLNKTIVSDIRLHNLLKNSAEVIQSNIKTEFVTFGIKQTESLPQQIIGSASAQHFKQADIDKVRALTPDISKKVILTDELDAEHSELKDILSHYNIGMLVRLATDVDSGREGIGYIVLGYKRSGSPFNSIDVKTMEIISNSMVVATQNSMRFEEIQHFNITLQKKVDDATRQLERTNKKLVAMDETKDEFISMASHQLRTPLTSVKGFISMLLDGDFGKVTPKQREILKETFASSQRMVYLIADFLNVSRIRTGKFVIELTDVNLPEIVTQELEQLKEMAASRNLTLEYSAPVDFPIIKLDDNKIRQVMMNFVDNAIYYTPSGGKIDIQLYATAKDIVYKVIDNGIGVPKSQQHKLFTKFFRADNAQKARPDGTGLGIFMAQKVIVAQGGTVIFESTEGKGSTFGFSFPLNKVK